MSIFPKNPTFLVFDFLQEPRLYVMDVSQGAGFGLVGVLKGGKKMHSQK